MEDRDAGVHGSIKPAVGALLTPAPSCPSLVSFPHYGYCKGADPRAAFPGFSKAGGKVRARSLPVLGEHGSSRAVGSHTSPLVPLLRDGNGFGDKRESGCPLCPLWCSVVTWWQGDGPGGLGLTGA